jgi:ABC-2 type transport system permease protein
MSTASITVGRIKYENRAFWRNPAAAFFTFAFPLMFLVIFDLLFGGDSTYYVAVICAFSIITATYTNLAISVSFSRDFGILKRMRGTPMPPAAYLAGRVMHSMLLSILLVVIVTVAGVVFYDVQVPTDTMPAFIVTVMVGAAAFCSLGLAMTAAVPNADAAPAVVNATVLPLLFISDVFIPTDRAPEWVNTLAGVFPIKHLSEAMQTAFNPATEGAGFQWDDLGLIALWGIVSLLLAIKFFSWEPRR